MMDPMVASMGAFAAYAMSTFGKEKPKTLEEWQSEAVKWEKQAMLAQQALLALAYSLATAMKACATLEEDARLTDLQTSANIRVLKARVKEAEAELAKLRAGVPAP